MKLDPTMFREYDIRGRESDGELNEHAMFLIGGYGSLVEPTFDQEGGGGTG